MIVPRTIGFEAEFERNVNELAQRLVAQGWSQTDHLHDYHCHCGGCALSPSNEYRFRAQRDATCAGEIITSVITLDQLSQTAETLSSAAYEVDAEPGLNAGLHVHVGVPHDQGDTRLGMLLTFALYEQSLARLAAGPFRALRGMNRTVAQSLAMVGEFDQRRAVPWTEQEIYAHIAVLLTTSFDGRLRAWDRIWQNWERHANLSPSTGHPTMEVRIWNSTRAAWRIELYCRISHHLASPDVTAQLWARAPEWLPEHDEPLDVVAQGAVLASVLGAEDPSLDSLIQRQLDAHAQILSTNDPIQFTFS